MRNPLLIPALALSLFFAGCAAWQPGGVVYSGDKNFSIKVPAGWTFTTSLMGPKTNLFATKDGVLLQQLAVTHHLDKDVFPNSKRSVTAQMSPFEVAEVIVDELRSSRGITNLNVVENTPATVGGQPGFKLMLTYQNSDNLRVTEVRYGSHVGDRTWFLRFTAPSRHYFEHELPALEEAAASFKLNKA